MASSLSGTRLEENGVDIRPEENGVGLSGKDGGQQIFSKRDLSQWGSDQGECGLWGSHGFVMSCMFLASNSSSRRGSSWISRSLGSDQQGLRLPIGTLSPCLEVPGQCPALSGVTVPQACNGLGVGAGRARDTGNGVSAVSEDRA